jgi:hypothetical protein
LGDAKIAPADTRQEEKKNKKNTKKEDQQLPTPVGTEKRKKKDKSSEKEAAPGPLLNGKAASFESPTALVSGKKYSVDGSEDQSGGGDGLQEEEEAGSLPAPEGGPGLAEEPVTVNKVGRRGWGGWLFLGRYFILLFERRYVKEVPVPYMFHFFY